MVDGSNDETSGNGEPKARRRFWRGVIAGVLALGVILAVTALVISPRDSEQALEPSFDETTPTLDTTTEDPTEDAQPQPAEDSSANDVFSPINPPEGSEIFEGPLNVVVTPEGQIVTSHDPDIIRVWTLDGNDELEQTHTVDGRGVTIVALADGRIASISARAGQFVYVWDPAEPFVDPVTINTEMRIRSIIALPDGQLLVAPFGNVQSGAPVPNSAFQIWDIETPDAVPITIPDRFVRGYGFTVLPDGQIAQASSQRNDDNIIIWDPSRPSAEPRTLGEHPGGVVALAVLQDGRLVSTGSDDIFRIWDVDDPDGRAEEMIAFGREARRMTPLLDGRLAFISSSGAIDVWDPTRTEEESRVSVGRNDPRTAIAGLPDGRILVGFEDELAPRLLDITDRSTQPSVVKVTDFATIPDSGSNGSTASLVLAGHTDLVRSIAELSDGRLVTISTDQTIRTWDPASTNQAQHVRSLELSETGPGNMLLTAVLPDDRVVIVETDGVVKLWDPNEPEAPFTFVRTPPRLAEVGADFVGVEVLPDGRIAIATDMSRLADRSIFIVDPNAPNAQPLRLVGTLPGVFRGVGLLDDGRIAAVGARGEIRVWNPDEPNAQPESFPTVGQIRAAAISDNRIAVAESDLRISNFDELLEVPLVLAIDPSTGESDEIVQIIPLPDGRILSADTGGSLRIWDPEEPAGELIVLPRRDEFTTRFFPPIEVLSEGRLAIGTEEGLIDIYDLGN